MQPVRILIIMERIKLAHMMKLSYSWSFSPTISIGDFLSFFSYQLHRAHQRFSAHLCGICFMNRLFFFTVALAWGAPGALSATSPKSNSLFYWMHVPKTGSSFTMTIEHVCCGNTSKARWGKESFEAWPCMAQCIFVSDMFPYGSHFALGKKSAKNVRTLDEKKFFSKYSVITNLRQPKARLQSGFFHSFHDCKSLQSELNVTEKGHVDRQGVDFIKSIIANETMLKTTLKQYVTCVSGCAVKMITGYSCGQDVSDSKATIPDPVMSKAVSLIEKFAFVGFQEHWDFSVKTFVSKFGGSFSEEMLTNNRPRHSAYTAEEVNKVASLLDQSAYQDPYDQALYEHALDFHWMQSQLKSHFDKNKNHDEAQNKNNKSSRKLISFPIAL
jgi:hypothetical protein